MEGGHHDLLTTHAVYHRLLQPAYERMIVQNVYRNKINLKSGASGQLLHKRPKTTGELNKGRGKENLKRSLLISFLLLSQKSQKLRVDCWSRKKNSELNVVVSTNKIPVWDSKNFCLRFFFV